MNTARIFHVLLVFAFAVSFLGAPAPASAQEYAISISACPWCHWITIHAGDVPDGTELTVTIDDPSTGPEPDYIKTAVKGPPDDIYPWTTFFLPEIELRPGFIVTVTAELTPPVSKTMIISPLAVTGVDFASDTVSGIATPGAPVTVWVRSTYDISRHPVADPVTGAWTADFSLPGVTPEDADTADLLPGCNGGAYEANPAGDDTWADWSSGSVLHIEVDPLEKWIQAYGWPLETVLTLTIDNPDNGSGTDFTETATVEHVDSSTHRADFAWPEIGLQPGFVVAVTGDGITKTLTVSDAQVTSVDIVNDRFTGMATPNKLLTVRSNDMDVITQSDGVGQWTADFTGKTDLQPGVTAEIDVLDDEADATQVRFDMRGRLTQPRLLASVNSNVVQARGWPINTTITLTIRGLDETFTAVMLPAPGDPANMRARFLIPDYMIKSGDVLMATGNGLTKTLIVSPLSITGVDLEDDRISGIGTPGTQILVGIYSAEGTSSVRWVTPDGSGGWTADFHVMGTGDDPAVFDLQPGSGGNVIEYDMDFDQTVRNWQVPVNQPPSIAQILAPISPVQLGQSINATVEFDDPDAGDTHTVTWEWGDGSSMTAPALLPSGTASHVYTSPGVYAITATITDASGESATATFQYVVIYDPSGAFVTGGGWIHSPPGAYLPNPSLSGKATFGFVAKYQKGASLPGGSTEFQFQTAGFRFTSTSYQWLVVAGSKAQFKGLGTLNDTGSYGFLLTAVDGQPDRFRIKIWDVASGAMLYDNMLDAAADELPTEIGAGAIVIHK